jgi:xanthine dehydrogenase accessory factor
LLETIAAVDDELPFVVATLVHVQGSAPQKPGARLLVHADGRLGGTIGGGCLEMETRRQALLMMGEGAPRMLTLRLDDDFGWDDGLICGGTATVWLAPDHRRWREFARNTAETLARGGACRVRTSLSGPAAGDLSWEPHSGGEFEPRQFVDDDGCAVLDEAWCPAPTLVVCGCGHVGNALVPLAAAVGFRVVAVDDRPDYADPQRLPMADQVECADLAEFARTFPSGPSTYWVIVTRGHRNDGRVLAGLMGRSKAYVGMIGSRRKVRLIREGLLAEGHPSAEVESVRAPVGLDIGARTPEEIALSIAAQLVQVRRNRVPVAR